MKIAGIFKKIMKYLPYGHSEVNFVKKSLTGYVMKTIKRSNIKKVNIWSKIVLNSCCCQMMQF